MRGLPVNLLKQTSWQECDITDVAFLNLKIFEKNDCNVKNVLALFALCTTTESHVAVIDRVNGHIA
jgi:hypothetical protein